MQIFSNAGQDEAEKIHKDAAKFIPAETVPSEPSPPPSEDFFIFIFIFLKQDWLGVCTNDLCLASETPEDFLKFNFGYDVVRDSKQAMKKQNPGWELPSTFFEKEPGAGVYP